MLADLKGPGGVSGTEAVGLAFIAFAAIVGRSLADPDALWPTVWKAFLNDKRRRFFDANRQPRAEVKEAMKAAVRVFGLRNAIGGAITGQRVYLRTVHLQYAIGTNWRDLSKHHAPAVVEDLLDEGSPNYSATFREFWAVYKRLRGGAIDIESAWQAIHDSPWAPAGGRKDLEQFAAHQQAPEGPSLARLFEEPRIVWESGKPRIRLQLLNGAGLMLDGSRFRVMISSGGESWTYLLLEKPDSAIGFVLHLSPDPGRIEIPFSLERIGIEVRGSDGMVYHTEEASIVEDSPIRLFDGDAGRELDLDDMPATDGRYYTLFFSGFDWRWDGDDDDILERYTIDDSWHAVRLSVSSKSASLIVDDERVWPLSNSSPAGISAGHSRPTLMASCKAASFDEDATVTITQLPNQFEPLQFRLLGNGYPVEMIAPGSAVAKIPVSPALRIEQKLLRPRLIAWDTKCDRRRVLPCEWHPPSLYGFAISSNQQWQPLRSVTDRAKVERSKIVRLHDADRRDSVLSGSRFCGLVDSSGSLHLAPGALGGWGEAMSVCMGPNDVGEAVSVVRAIGDTGEIEWADWIKGDVLRITFRGTYELDPNRHRVEVWLAGESLPGTAETVQLDDAHWEVRCPAVADGANRPLGVAVFYGVDRVGSRWLGGLCPPGLGALVRETSDWPATFHHLVRWKAPLLHPSVIQCAQVRCEQDVPGTLVPFLEVAPQAEGTWHEYLIREMLERWVPAQATAAAALGTLHLLPADPFDLLSGGAPRLVRGLNVEPAAMSGLVILGLATFYEQATEDELKFLMELILAELFKSTGSTSSGDWKKPIDEQAEGAARELQVDPHFLSAVVLKAARLRAGLETAEGGPARWQTKALLYCLSSPSARRWIAATLLDEFRRKLMVQSR